MLYKKFENQVKKTPNNIAVKQGETKLTYWELKRAVHQISEIISRSTQGKITGLLFEHGIHMIITILGALKAGKVVVPLSSDYPEKRLAYMIENSKSSLIITDKKNEPLARRLNKLAGKPFINIQEYQDTPIPEEIKETEPRKGIAYILYTSGSTGKPKGVMQTHKNADYYNRSWMKTFSITSNDRMTLFSSFCHDGSLQDIYSALHSGATLFPFNVKELNTFHELTDFLKNERITIWHSVPSIFSSFVSSLEYEGQANLTFSNVRFVLLGGEPIREYDLDMCKRYFPNARLASVYGQTESSVNTIHIMNQEYEFKRPILGKPLEETQIYIIDEKGNQLLPLQVGEIVISSQYISPGYWKNPKATREAFSHEEDNEQGSLYWTGDLGSLLVDGNIEFIGRKDNQVKIRGYRVEIGEVESQLLQHPAIREAVVTTWKDQNQESYLCAYVTHHPSQSPQVQDLKNHLSGELPDYMIPSRFIIPEKMPLTPNGKIDRKALPEPEGNREVIEYKPPHDSWERKLVEIWSHILGIHPEKIGVETEFLDLGGHSLKAILITSRIFKEFQVTFSLAELFRLGTIRKIASWLKKVNKEGFIMIPSVEKKEYYRLSSSQKRLFILHLTHTKSLAYNMPVISVVDGPLEREKMEHCFKQLVKRHDSFRSSFYLLRDEPVQKIPDTLQMRFQYEDLSLEISEEGGVSGNGVNTNRSRYESLVEEFIKPFNLAQAPLFRVKIVKTGKHMHLLMVDLHHIISDGFSNQILIKEFLLFYEGITLPQLRIQYKEVAHWQNMKSTESGLKKQKDYWETELRGEIPLLKLPCDFPRTDSENPIGDQVVFELYGVTLKELKNLALREEVTMFTLLFAIYCVLLFKITGQTDIVVGTVIAGRTHPDMETIIGMFVNTLAIRSKPKGTHDFKMFIKAMRKNLLMAFDNQEYQFEELVNTLKPLRENFRNPIFDVVFNYTSWGESPKGLSGLQITPFQREAKQTKFDLILAAEETKESLVLGFIFNTGLFKKQTIRRFEGYFKEILNTLLKEPGLLLEEIRISHDLNRVTSDEYTEEPGGFDFN